MSAILRSITADALAASAWRGDSPLVLDVRRPADFEAQPRLVPGAIRVPPGSEASLPADVIARRSLVVYCAHGRSVSQGICEALGARGANAAYLEGGHAAWSASQPTIRWRAPLSERPSRWITRERPKIDRIACPWLVRRFIDPLAEFLYVPTGSVLSEAERLGAIPYDVPDVEFSHAGEQCSFDAFLRCFDLRTPALDRLAAIVRGADTARLDLAPQAAGLLAISLGLSLNFADDLAMLEQGCILYDALYSWCRRGQGEGHDWKPEAMRVTA